MTPATDSSMDPLAQREFARLLEAFPDAEEITLKPGTRPGSDIVDCSLKIINGSVTQGVPGLTQIYTLRQQRRNPIDLDAIYRALLGAQDSSSPESSNSSIPRKPSRSNEKIAKDYLEQGEIEDAIHIIKQILSSTIRDDLFAKTAKHYLKNGKVEDAIHIIKQILSSTIRDDLFAKTAKHYLKNGKVEDAIHIIGQIQRDKTQFELYKRVFDFYINNDRTDDAATLVEKVLMNLESYAVRIKMAEKNGLRTLVTAQKKEFTSKACTVDEMYVQIVDSYMKNGQDKKANTFIEKIYDESRRDSVRVKYGL